MPSQNVLFLNFESYRDKYTILAKNSAKILYI